MMTADVEPIPAASTPRVEPFEGASSSNAQAPVTPFLIPSDQLYYWTSAWQAGERESMEDVVAGDTVSFGDARSAIAWLFSSDDD